MDGALLDGAFLICGHGGEHRDCDNDMIVVPDDCIIVVLMHYGESMPRVKLVEIHQKLYQLQKQSKKQGQGNILHDPLNHIPALLEICGSLAIYQAGAECPNFDYHLFDCLSATECYNAPVGVINLDTWSEPPEEEFENTLHTSARPSQIIDHFSSPYQDSIYPTEKEIEDTVKEVIAQSNAQTPSLQAIYHAIEKKTDVTLSGILDFRKDEFHKRVYYHGLCRSKKDVTNALKHSFTDMITLHKNIEQIERAPLWGSHNRKEVSHTSNEKNRAITLKKGVIRALKHRIGETAKHRTPHIKTWMNSPVYQLRRRKEVKKELRDIEQRIRYVMQHINFLQKKIERMAPLESLSEEYASTERNIKDAQAQLELLKKEKNTLIEWEKSMDTPPSPPISYVQENKRWKSQHDNEESDAERNAERNALEHLNHAVLPIRGSTHDREQLQRMREAYARFKKGRDEYMEQQRNSESNDYERNMAYMTNEMKGYERGIKRLEYLTNVVPPFHTSRVKIDKNKQLQGMRNAHARFTASRKKYMENKASASDTHPYKKNMNYFNRMLRDYEKGIHNAEQPSNSYTRVNRNGTVKWIRK